MCPGVTWPYIPGNAIPLAVDPPLAGVDNPSGLFAEDTAAGIAAAVDTVAEHTAADRTEVVVGHMEVGHTAAAAVGTVADRMGFVHRPVAAVAVVVNNLADHTGSDTVAAVAGIAQTA